MDKIVIFIFLADMICWLLKFKLMTYMYKNYVYSKSILLSFTIFQNQNNHIDNPTFKCLDINLKCLKLNVQSSPLRYSNFKCSNTSTFDA